MIEAAKIFNALCVAVNITLYTTNNEVVHIAFGVIHLVFLYRLINYQNRKN